MGAVQSSRYCEYCEERTLHEHPSFSDGVGCIATLLTAGLFLPFWIGIKVLEALTGKWRCQTCGTAQGITGLPVAAVVAAIFGVGFVPGFLYFFLRPVVSRDEGPPAPVPVVAPASRPEPEPAPLPSNADAKSELESAKSARLNGQEAAAIYMLRKLIKAHPGTAEAQAAKDQLGEMRAKP